MLRRTGISARLYLLATLVVAALVGLIAVTYSAISGLSTHQRDIVTAESAQGAARTLEYDFANLNGLQNAFALAVGRAGTAAASDTAPARKAYLAAVTRTQSDLETLQNRLAGRQSADQTAISGVSSALAEVSRIDDQAIALYRRGDPVSRSRA
jgi:hypothetical protein